MMIWSRRFNSRAHFRSGPLATLLFALLTAAPQAPFAGEPGSCPESFARIQTTDPAAGGRPRSFSGEIRDYWAREFQFLSPSSRQGITRRTAGATSFLLGNAVRVSFPPIMILGNDLPRSVVSAVRAMRGPQGAGPARLLLIPVDIAQRAAPGLAGYVGLTAVGASVPVLLARRSVTLDEMKQVMPAPRDVGPGELVVIVDTNMGSETGSITDYMRMTYSQDSKRPGGPRMEGKVFQIKTTDPETLYEALGRLPGQIKELHWVVHSAWPGELLVNSGGSSDAWNAEKLHGGLRYDAITGDTILNSPAIRAWRPGVFAPDARILLYACSVGKGKAGDQFARQLGSVMLSNGSFVAAPTLPVYPGTRAELESDMKKLLPTELTFQNFQETAAYHWNFLLLTMISERLGVPALLDALTPGPAEPRIKVLEFPPVAPSER